MAEEEEQDERVALAEFLINSLSTLTANFVFINAILRNINSGENTMAWHQTPYVNAGVNIFGFIIKKNEIRYNGYNNGAAAQLGTGD